MKIIGSKIRKGGLRILLVILKSSLNNREVLNSSTVVLQVILTLLSRNFHVWHTTGDTFPKYLGAIKSKEEPIKDKLLTMSI